MTEDEIVQRLAKLVAATTKAAERIARGEIILAERTKNNRNTYNVSGRK